VPSLIRALVRAGVHAPRPEGIDLHPFLVDGVERALIEEIMRECGGTQITAAKRLGINRNTLHKKWEQYKSNDRAASPLETSDEMPPSEAAAG
jgi:DNA-binding NtrC family response regulator